VHWSPEPGTEDYPSISEEMLNNPQQAALAELKLNLHGYVNPLLMIDERKRRKRKKEKSEMLSLFVGSKIRND
jgi:hypothetical protein